MATGEAQWGSSDIPTAASAASGDHLLIRKAGLQPNQQVQEATLAQVVALAAASGGFNPTPIGQSTVSVDNLSWVATTVAIASSVSYFLVRVDLQRARGIYLVSGAQWRGLSTVAHGDDADGSRKIPLTRDHYFSRSFSFGIGRVTGDMLAVQYDGGQAGLGSFLVQALSLG